MRAPRLDAARIAFLAAFAAAVLYAPTLRHGFTFDDGLVVVQNRWIRSLADLPTLVSRSEWSGAGVEVKAWRPLTDATYALNHAATGDAPWSFHLANLLLHAGAAALLAVLAVRLGLPPGPALAAALLFAVHPIRVEAVANVAGRKDVLATVFVLAQLLAHRRALARGGAATWAAPLLFAGALLSKEVGVTGIALCAILDLAARPRSPRPGAAGTARWLYGAYALLAAGWIFAWRAVTAAAGAPIPFSDNPVAHAPAAERIATAVAVLGKGLLLQLFPAGQSPDWSYDALPVAASFLDPRVLATLAALAGWAAAGYALRRRAPLVLAGLAWYVAALLPASNLLFPIGTLFGERLLYLPGIGLGLAVAAAGAVAVERWPRAHRFAAVALLVACHGLGAVTTRYAAAWADDERLFQHAERSVPRSGKVQHELASLAFAAGRTDEALARLARAATLDPSNARVFVTRAAVLRASGRTAEEAAALRTALALAPGDADALYGLGRLARDDGRLEEAAALWQGALAGAPAHAASLADLGGYHLARGEPGLAEARSLAAVRADEGLASAWYNLGLARRAQGDEAGARAALAEFARRAGPEYAVEAEAIRRELDGR